MKEYLFVAPCLFGIESILADEIRKLGYETDRVEDGRVYFKGDLAAAARANINLRTAERVQLVLAEFLALSFDDLFEGAKKIELADFLPKDAVFPVSGHSLKSKLTSVPDCQKIIKKALADKLSEKYKISWLPETGDNYPISFLIMKDKAVITLDLSGEGLHKRGYRQKANLAPIRETLASAMLNITRFRSGIPFWDPFAGSGTIAIEAAMIAAGIAPGLRREFISEKHAFVPSGAFTAAREEAKSKIKTEKTVIAATDIDPEMKTLGERNARLAGVEGMIKFGSMEIRKLTTKTESGIICCNPPYGERLLEKQQAEELYKIMGKVFPAMPDWKYFIITSDEEFEKYFGQKADKKRKLYNGMIKCDFYQYFKR